jgi:hypothetical protein
VPQREHDSVTSVGHGTGRYDVEESFGQSTRNHDANIIRQALLAANFKLLGADAPCTPPPAMVLLTVTPSIARAITEAHKIAGDEFEKIHLPDEPLLADAEAGKPISHSQLIQLSRLLKENADKIAHAEGEQEEVVCTLDSLLKGSKIYIPPPPPKQEPVSHLCIPSSRIY